MPLVAVMLLLCGLSVGVSGGAANAGLSAKGRGGHRFRAGPASRTSRSVAAAILHGPKVYYGV